MQSTYLWTTALIRTRHQSAQCKPKHHRRSTSKIIGSEHGAICRVGFENHFRCSNLPALISQSIREERDIQTQLDRAKKGDAVIFGPFKNPESSDASPNNPEMGVLTAVRNENNSVLAIMLVTRIGMYQEFSRMFFDIANAGNLDAYAVNEIGTMLTESPRAATLPPPKDSMSP